MSVTLAQPKRRVNPKRQPITTGGKTNEKGLLAKKFLAQNAPSFLVFVSVGCLAECVRAYAVACINTVSLVPYPYLLYALLPRFVWSILFSLAVYAPVRGVQRVMERK